MRFPIKVCVICGEEFELKPDKPGFATHCPNCTEEQAVESNTKRAGDADETRVDREANEERRKAIRNLLYRKDE